ncbi:MAG: branched-chain amino acid transaminase [Desulfovibrio sp.]|nr:branched-chain amino acid transaminase [Desulfovibrio sp.]
MQTTQFIWFDGKMLPWDQARVHVLTHALHYGSAVFEGMRAYSCTDGTSAVFRLADHCKRLVNSAKILRFKLPYSAEHLAVACVETLQANKLAEGYVRPLSFVGYGELGVYPGDNPVQTIIAVWPWGAYLGAEALEKGIRVKTSSFARMHVNTLMTKAKSSGNYINSILAKMEAKGEGYDEAVMLDTAGFVSEASGENIFIVRDGVLKTTPWTSILGGITRDSIIKLARDVGYIVEEQQFTRDEFYIADEAFFTGTAAELTPIRELDHRVIGAGGAGPVTRRLQKEFFKVVRGENVEYADWLHRYNV